MSSISKSTILEIKKEHLIGNKLNNINKELEALKILVHSSNLEIDIALFSQLKIEDGIRSLFLIGLDYKIHIIM